MTDKSGVLLGSQVENHQPAGKSLDVIGKDFLGLGNVKSCVRYYLHFGFFGRDRKDASCQRSKKLLVE